MKISIRALRYLIREAIDNLKADDPVPDEDAEIEGEEVADSTMSSTSDLTNGMYPADNNRPADNYRPTGNYRAEDPMAYIGMSPTPQPSDNYRSEDPAEYIGMRTVTFPSSVEGEEDLEAELDADADDLKQE